jgi:hypothetical protein
MKKILSIILILIILTTMMSACTTETDIEDVNKNTTEGNISVPNETESDIDSSKLNNYKINAELDTTAKVLKVQQDIKYVNNEDIELKELYFHVYANAFKSKDTAPFLFDDFEEAYPRGFDPGYTEILSIRDTKMADEQLKFNFQGEGETILKIELINTLNPGEYIELSMDYIVHIPPAGERFGWGNNNFNLGNWYPIAAVYDKQDGWNLDKYYAIGDPFYSDTSNYTVNIKTPRDYIIAASGKLISDSIDGDKRLWEFEASKMRDFAFVANSQFEIEEYEVDGTLVKSYYYKTHAERGKQALQIGINSIRLFNEKFGKYPYPTYSVVETEFPSGMEYPGLVYISDESYEPDTNEGWFVTVVVHETAHQWWYSLVGNDQIDEAWLDEGFASYSEKVYNEKYFGKTIAQNQFDNNEAIMRTDIGKTKVVRSLSEFKDWSDYGPIAYSKGAVVLNEIRKSVGDVKFYNILQTYFKRYKFKIATTESFIDVCEEISGKDMDSFFNNWLYAK